MRGVKARTRPWRRPGWVARLLVVDADTAAKAAAVIHGRGVRQVIAALWGVFIWKEFRDAPKGTSAYITAMFLFFIAGLGLVIYAGME